MPRPVALKDAVRFPLKLRRLRGWLRTEASDLRYRRRNWRQDFAACRLVLSRQAGTFTASAKKRVSKKGISMMRVARISKANGPFELVECEVPEPGPNSVRVAVDACGVCHSDSLTKMAAFPGMALPRVPGHEVVGRIDVLGPGVEGWTIGQRVGVGWHGGYCGKCNPCRRGKFFACVTGPPITGISPTRPSTRRLPGSTGMPT